MDQGGFQVNSSLLNAVKFELAVILIWAVFLFVVLEFITPDLSIQILVLGSFGVGSMTWLIIRTRTCIRQAKIGAIQPNVGEDRAAQ